MSSGVREFLRQFTIGDVTEEWGKLDRFLNVPKNVEGLDDETKSFLDKLDFGTFQELYEQIRSDNDKDKKGEEQLDMESLIQNEEHKQSVSSSMKPSNRPSPSKTLIPKYITYTPGKIPPPPYYGVKSTLFWPSPTPVDLDKIFTTIELGPQLPMMKYTLPDTVMYKRYIPKGRGDGNPVDDRWTMKEPRIRALVENKDEPNTITGILLEGRVVQDNKINEWKLTQKGLEIVYEKNKATDKEKEALFKEVNFFKAKYGSYTTLMEKKQFKLQEEINSSVLFFVILNDPYFRRVFYTEELIYGERKNITFVRRTPANGPDEKIKISISREGTETFVTIDAKNYIDLVVQDVWDLINACKVNTPSITAFYANFDIPIGTVEPRQIQRGEKRNIDVLKSVSSDLFSRNYSVECPKFRQPEVTGSKEGLMEKGYIPVGDKFLVCKNPKHPYIRYLNDQTDPCCFAKDKDMTVKKGGTKRSTIGPASIGTGTVGEAIVFGKQADIRKESPLEFGKILNTALGWDGTNEKFIRVRTDVTNVMTNFIDAVGQCLESPRYFQDDPAKTLSYITDTLSRGPADFLRQEMYHLTGEEIQSLAKKIFVTGGSIFVHSNIWYQVLEYVYRCNIFVLTGKDNVRFEIPVCYGYHVRTFNPDNPTILLYLYDNVYDYIQTLDRISVFNTDKGKNIYTLFNQMYTEYIIGHEGIFLGYLNNLGPIYTDIFDPVSQYISQDGKLFALKLRENFLVYTLPTAPLDIPNDPEIINFDGRSTEEIQAFFGKGDKISVGHLGVTMIWYNLGDIPDAFGVRVKIPNTHGMKSIGWEAPNPTMDVKYKKYSLVDWTSKMIMLLMSWLKFKGVNLDTVVKPVKDENFLPNLRGVPRILPTSGDPVKWLQQYVPEWNKEIKLGQKYSDKVKKLTRQRDLKVIPSNTYFSGYPYTGGIVGDELKPINVPDHNVYIGLRQDYATEPYVMTVGNDQSEWYLVQNVDTLERALTVCKKWDTDKINYGLECIVEPGIIHNTFNESGYIVWDPTFSNQEYFSGGKGDMVYSVVKFIRGYASLLPM